MNTEQLQATVTAAFEVARAWPVTVAPKCTCGHVHDTTVDQTRVLDCLSDTCYCDSFVPAPNPYRAALLKVLGRESRKCQCGHGPRDHHALHTLGGHRKACYACRCDLWAPGLLPLNVAAVAEALGNDAWFDAAMLDLARLVAEACGWRLELTKVNDGFIADVYRTKTTKPFPPNGRADTELEAAWQAVTSALEQQK